MNCSKGRDDYNIHPVDPQSKANHQTQDITPTISSASPGVTESEHVSPVSKSDDDALTQDSVVVDKNDFQCAKSTEFLSSKASRRQHCQEAIDVPSSSPMTTRIAANKTTVTSRYSQRFDFPNKMTNSTTAQVQIGTLERVVHSEIHADKGSNNDTNNSSNNQPQKRAMTQLIGNRKKIDQKMTPRKAAGSRKN